MAVTHNMKQRIIDDAIEALQNAGDDSTIDVRMEGTRIVIIVNAAGGGKHAAVSRKAGRPAIAAKQEARVAPDGATAKILAVLHQEKNHRGLNLVGLTKAIGMNKKEKSSLRPIVQALIRSKELRKVGQLIRRTDVEVHPGRKAAPKAEKTAPKKARRDLNLKPDEGTPAGNEKFTYEAVASILRAHPPGYSMVELTKKLGASPKSKMQLKPVLAQMTKLSGANQVEKKGPFYRLKNLERKPGRKAQGDKPAKVAKATGKRGPGRPKGSKNKTSAKAAKAAKVEKPEAAKSAKADKPAKRGPGRPPGSKNKVAKAETAKPAKRSVGRPKGSTNKVAKAATVEEPTKTDKPAKPGAGRPKGSKNKKAATPAATTKKAKVEVKALPEKTEAAEDLPAEIGESGTKPEKEPSLSELIKAARDTGQAEMKGKKTSKKNHKQAKQDELDESGQPKRELTRVPVEEEERNHGAAE